MSTLNLVEYGSDDDDFAPAPAVKPNPQKAPTDKPASSAQPQKSADSKDTGAKRVIKYSSLQTSKNLLDKNADDDKAEEWKPTSVDFSKKNDPNQAAAEKPAFKSKKGNSYAASFLSNLPKPNKELKNVSQILLISDSYSYDRDSTDEVITKKVKLDRVVEDDEDEDEEAHPVVETGVPHYSSLKKREAANLMAFTEEDRQIVFQNDKSNKIGLQGDSGMLEINANNLADPNWESNVEKSMARMNDPRYKLGQQQSKAAKSKNQLVSLAYDNMSKDMDAPSGKKEMVDARKRTHNRYGW